jgi:hypothetical protein
MNNTQTQYKQEPKAKLGGLYEKKSAKGQQYFVGYFGGFKLLILPEQNHEPCKPEWAVFAVERVQQEGQHVTPQATQQAFQAQGRQQAYQQHNGPPQAHVGYQQLHDTRLPY